MQIKWIAPALAALTLAAQAEAERYLAFLRSALARGIFESYGFTFLPGKSAR